MAAETYSNRATHVSGVSEKVSLPTQSSVGQGLSTVSGVLRGTALQLTQANVVTTTENAVSYDLKYVDSYDELAQTLRLDARASFSGFSGGASASMSLFRSARMSNSNAYAVVRMTVVTGTQSLGTFTLTSDALRRLTMDGGLNYFQSSYGDAFVRQVVLGAELYALLEFSVRDANEKQALKVDVAGSYGAFSAGASLEQTMERLTQNRNVRVIYTQSGAGTGRDPVEATKKKKRPQQAGDETIRFAETGGVLIFTPEEFLGRVRDFPAEARKAEKNSAVLWGEVTDYNVASNLPAGVRIPPPIGVRWALEDVGRVKFAVDQNRDTLRDVMTSGQFATSDQKRAFEVLPHRDYASRELDRIGEALMAYPSLLPKLSAVNIASEGQFEKAYKDSKNKKGADLIKVLQDRECPVLVPAPEIAARCLFGDPPFNPVPVAAKVTLLSGTHSVPGNYYGEYWIPFRADGKKAFQKVPRVVANGYVGGDIGRHTDSFLVSVRQVNESAFLARVIRVDRNEGARAGLTIGWIAHEPD